MYIIQAINEIAPNARWTMEDCDYNTLVWNSPDIQVPTLDEINIKIEEIVEREKIEKPMRILREHRNQLLSETDWWAVSDRTMTQEQINYRQALRDLTLVSNPVLDSDNPIGISGVVWPLRP